MKKHEQLQRACKGMKKYLKLKINTVDLYNSDCSCGCKWFAELSGKVGMDWGVCFNLESPRAGLLTFEHMGCIYFE